ncbi:acyl-homoserine-lactone synthase [Sphingomonas colocasiae]|uniref:Acyl-homoserine-lactone synthase n=1 Tax=Sphingomonas colocasiae TaxID=1848973 RepID=A0ABS7PPL4_9SPHN|nr:acyl-homoserine-lactone synthase [Sphingomonas colocasiae]MBY8823265.1 autoinducer synthase [Sphingomonas colocasiae]
MLHLIDHNSQSEGAILRAMFEARKRVFVDLLRWNVPVVGGSWEMDRFDNEDARYLVLSDERGHHLASARLLRTDRPHILDTLFSGLCEGPVPSDAATLEITRFCIDRNLASAERRRARNQLVTALVEHALAHGIARFTAVAEMRWARQILAFGWSCVPLGPPVRHESGLLGALLIEIDADTPFRLLKAGIYSAPARGGRRLSA